MPAGVSIELGTLVGFRSGSGQRLYSPYLHNFFCNAYGASSPVCQGYLWIFLFYLLPPGGSQFGGRCFSFAAVLDGAGGIYIQLVFKAPLCITLTISDQKIVSGSLFFKKKKKNYKSHFMYSFQCGCTRWYSVQLGATWCKT